jgi:hypothetical protein
MQKIYRFFPFPIAVLAVLLGTLGFRLVSNETSFSTCLYQAAQLFTISSGAIQGKLPWSLELARWLAPMATLGAILLAARSFFYAFLARFKSLAYHNHTILCGAGDRGLAIVCRIKTQGQQVVVIDTNDESVSANKIRSLGIPLFIGDGMDDKIIRIAGIKRAKRLIATCGSDEINLRIAGNLNGKTEAEIIAAVEKPSLRILFRDQIGTGKDRQSVRMVGFQFRAAKRLFYSLAMNLFSERGLSSKGLHVFLEVNDDLIEDFIRAAALILQITGEKKPSFTILTKNRAVRENFLLRYPENHLVADLNWVSTCPSQDISSKHSTVFDAAVFCCHEDMTTLERAENFHALDLCRSENIYACLQKAANARFSNTTDFVRKNLFQVIDLVGFSLGGNDPLDGHLEIEAIRLHQDYVQNERLKDPSWDRLPADWRFLDEGYRESNRLQAANLELNRLSWKLCPESQRDDLLGKLARAEHMRWMADKVMHGWRWSGSIDPASRNDKKRVHHLLVPFDSLCEAEKSKDLSPLKKILSSAL